MAKRVNLSIYIFHIILCAAAYCIPAFIVLSSDRYQSVWILFVGNSLFLIAMLFAIIKINSKLNQDGNLRTLILSGVSIIIPSVVLVAIIVSLMYFGFNISSLGTGEPNTVLKNVPSNTSTDGATNGLVFMLMVSGLFINILVGCFAAFIAAATSKQKQETAKGHKADVTNDVTK